MQCLPHQDKCFFGWLFVDDCKEHFLFEDVAFTEGFSELLCGITKLTKKALVASVSIIYEFYVEWYTPEDDWPRDIALSWWLQTVVFHCRCRRLFENVHTVRTLCIASASFLVCECEVFFFIFLDVLRSCCVSLFCTTACQPCNDLYFIRTHLTVFSRFRFRRSKHRIKPARTRVPAPSPSLFHGAH